MPGPTLTSADRELLSFIGVHRFAVSAQAQALLGCSEAAARSRLNGLTSARYLIRQPVLAGQPVTYRSTRVGLDAVGIELRPRPVSAAQYHHDAGAAWLWLAGRNGAFGPMREVLAERLLRSRDAKDELGEDPFGVRLGGLGANERERLHYPDLLLIDPAGRRLAIELELTSKSTAKRQRILGGYAADARIARVLYVVYEPRVARALSVSVSRMRISGLVSIQRVRAPARPSAPAARPHAVERRDPRPVAGLAR